MTTYDGTLTVVAMLERDNDRPVVRIDRADKHVTFSQQLIDGRDGHNLRLDGDVLILPGYRYHIDSRDPHGDYQCTRIDGP